MKGFKEMTFDELKREVVQCFDDLAVALSIGDNEMLCCAMFKAKEVVEAAAVNKNLTTENKKELKEILKEMKKEQKKKDAKTYTQLIEMAHLTESEAAGIEDSLERIGDDLNIAQIVGDEASVRQCYERAWVAVEQLDNLREIREAAFTLKEQRKIFDKEIGFYRSCFMNVISSIDLA